MGNIKCIVRLAAAKVKGVVFIHGKAGGSLIAKGIGLGHHRLATAGPAGEIHQPLDQREEIGALANALHVLVPGYSVHVGSLTRGIDRNRDRTGLIQERARDDGVEQVKSSISS